MGRTWVAACAALIMSCGTGDNRVDPGDLELRDLLGMAPDVAGHWDAAQRASARQVLAGGFEVEATTLPLADPAIEVAIGAVDTPALRPAPKGLAIVMAGRDLTTGDLEVELSDRWRKHADLASRQVGLFAALAADAGHTTGKVVVVPVPRMSAIAGYVAARGTEPARLVVNPVILAAIDPIDAIAPDVGVEPSGADVARHAAPMTTLPSPMPLGGGFASTGGNPYSFYGSVAECAAAQRGRCESCMASGNCKPVTTDKDGNDECAKLADAGGRGYYLLCINLSLAITSVEDCAAQKASSCARVDNAASDLGMLAVNADFLDDSTCSQELDNCLASIYGAPSGSFPSADGGTDSSPPRNTSAGCTTCSNNNCDASPSCTGPTCGNSLSCDSTCSSSTDQSGCGGNCDGCKSSGGGGGNSGSGCSSGGGSTSSNGCSGNGDSCSSGNSSGCSGSSSSGSSCGSSSSGSSSSSGCGGGSCGSSSSSSSSSGCGGGGGSGGCSVARAEPDARVVLGVSVAWGFLPVPIGALIRRRARRKKSEVRS